MSSVQTESIRNNTDKVLERIRKIAVASGRNPEKITLIAVTKKKPAAVIKALAEYGISDIGESYLKEALFKIELLKDLNIHWHMIGAIQRGKEKEIAAKFSDVHSLESKKIAIQLNKYAKIHERYLPVYLEFNVSGEESKHGWDAWKEDQWPDLLPEIQEVLDLSNLDVKGLMTMAPYSNDSQTARPYFKRLRELRDYLSRQFPAEEFNGLSMGMSGDYEVAIEEGATVLRIGSALVGPR